MHSSDKFRKAIAEVNPSGTRRGERSTENSDNFQLSRSHALIAGVHAMAVMGIAGEIAAPQAAGLGSLQIHFQENVKFIIIRNYKERSA